MLFDTHAHYNDKRYETEVEGGAPALLKEVFGSGVTHIINVGFDVASSRQSVALASEYPNIYAAVGVHPTERDDIKYLDEDINALSSMLDEKGKNKIVAVGEIGFDYHYEETNKPLQREYFDAQLTLAEKYGVPVIIHDRDAHGDCLERVFAHPAVKGVFHSFSGSRESASELLSRGWYISFSGVVTFKNAERVREVCASIPTDRLLIETDCPYLAPTPHRGELNHSGLMKYTTETVAELHGMTAEELSDITAQNAARLFGIKL